MKKYQQATLAAVCESENLYRAYKLARLGSVADSEVLRFEANLYQELGDLQRKLLKHEYRVGEYWLFWVYEPKSRLIMALPFRDRVVHHALCLVIRPCLEKHFITGNAANRTAKGTHYAIKLLTQQLVHLHRRHPKSYCLKCDIAGFFYNIDQDIMKRKLREMFNESGILWLMDVIIDSTPMINNQPKKGLPIGNLTSQFWAIYYLSALDHFVKEKLKIKYYVRYMDDFTLLHHDKKYLQSCKEEIRKFLWQDTALELNKKTQIFALSQGVNFLGWRFYQTETGKVIKVIRQDSKHRRRRLNKQWQRDFAMAKNFAELRSVYEAGRQSWNSWLAHASHGHTYRLRLKMTKELQLKNIAQSSNMEDNN